MGIIKDLRAKVKDGTATDGEKEQLEELEAEAADEAAESPEAEAEVAEPEADEKGLVELGKKLAQIAMNEMQKVASHDSKKGALSSNKAEPKGEKLTGAARVKAFFLALLENDHTKLDHLSEGTNADGGFLVPQEYAQTFVEDLRDQVVMRKAGATVIQVTSNTFNVPSLSTRPLVYWTNELAAKSSTSASWANQTLTPYTLAAIMTASNQVIADAKIGGNLIDVMTRLLTQAIAEVEDKAFFTGSGTGQPSGLNSYTFSTVSAGGALSADHVINAVYTLPQAYRNKAVVFANKRAIRVLRELKDTQNRYIFENAIAGTNFPTVLGMPIYEQNDLESTSIFIGDPSYYWIADREGVSVRVSDEATVGSQSAFERNFTAVRVEKRTDGEVVLTRAFVEITSVNAS